MEEIRKKKEKADRIKKEFERRMNPKTKEDFDLLYHALESEFLFIFSVKLHVGKIYVKAYATSPVQINIDKCTSILITIKILKFGTPQTIAIIVLK